MFFILPSCRRALPAVRYVCALAGLVLSIVVLLADSQAVVCLSLTGLALVLWCWYAPSVPDSADEFRRDPE